MQVCAACHSVQQLHFRNLVDVAYTEDEGKAMAADIEVRPTLFSMNWEPDLGERSVLQARGRGSDSRVLPLSDVACTQKEGKAMSTNIEVRAVG